jgi:hypothetical protein
MELEDLEDQIEYSQFKGKWKEAISFLQEVQNGIAVAALQHPKIGDIDLVWGNYKEDNRISSGFGLAKIAEKHPEVLENMQYILLQMQVKYINEVVGYNLKGYGYKGNVRITLNGRKRLWLMTLYEKE